MFYAPIGRAVYFIRFELDGLRAAEDKIKRKKIDTHKTLTTRSWIAVFGRRDHCATVFVYNICTNSTKDLVETDSSLAKYVVSVTP